MLQGFVPNQGDAWQFTLNELHRYFEHAATVGPCTHDREDTCRVAGADGARPAGDRIDRSLS